MKPNPAMSVFLCVALLACQNHSSTQSIPAKAQGKSKTIEAPVVHSSLPFPPLGDVYAATHKGMFSPNVIGVPERVYVPNSKSGTVSIINPKTFQVINTFKVGAEPMHIVPSWDLKTLWVASDVGNTLTSINPRTGARGVVVHVKDPYNLYFTPDGKYAMVVAEYKHRLDFLNAKTMTPAFTIDVPCKGINHMDFSQDGTFVLAACEFSGTLLKIEIARRTVVAQLHLGGMPQDVKLSPDGQVFFVADMDANGLHVIDANNMQNLEFIHTGKGAHGLYPSRDGKNLYISNRAEGSVSVLQFSKRKIIGTWRIPGGGSPDMGGVSADGSELWLSGRTNSEVYVFNTSTGKLKARIRVGRGPHGLAIFPQPGRYSLGHTGVYR